MGTNKEIKFGHRLLLSSVLNSANFSNLIDNIAFSCSALLLFSFWRAFSLFRAVFYPNIHAPLFVPDSGNGVRMCVCFEANKILYPNRIVRNRNFFPSSPTGPITYVIRPVETFPKFPNFPHQRQGKNGRRKYYGPLLLYDVSFSIYSPFCCGI